ALSDEQGGVTQVALSVLRPFSGTNLNGTPSAAGGLNLGNNVVRDSFWGNDADRPYSGQANPNGAIRIQGLDNNAVYDLEFFASRMQVNDNREAQYTVSGSGAAQTVY